MQSIVVYVMPTYRLRGRNLRINDNVLLVRGALRGAETKKVELERRGATAENCSRGAQMCRWSQESGCG